MTSSVTGGAGRVEGKGHSKKKGCPKDDLPEKPGRSSFFFTTDFAGRPPPPGHRQAAPPRHRGRAQIPKIRGPRGSNTQKQGSQLDYGGFLAEIRPFYPLQNKAKYPQNPQLWERNPQNPDSSAGWHPCENRYPQNNSYCCSAIPPNYIKFRNLL